jgi:hypothetical protein
MWQLGILTCGDQLFAGVSRRGSQPSPRIDLFAGPRRLLHHGFVSFVSCLSVSLLAGLSRLLAVFLSLLTLRLRKLLSIRRLSQQRPTNIATLPAAARDRSAIPIFLFKPPYRGRSRVLDLEPVRRSAGAVRRAEPLGHDALAAERSGVLVDRRAVAGEYLIECNAGVRHPQQSGEPPFAVLDRLAADVLAVHLE